MPARNRDIVAELNHGTGEFKLNSGYVGDDDRVQYEAKFMLNAYSATLQEKSLLRTDENADIAGGVWDTIMQTRLNLGDEARIQAFWDAIEFEVMPKLMNRHSSYRWQQIVLPLTTGFRFRTQLIRICPEEREGWAWFLLRHILLFHPRLCERNWDLVSQNYVVENTESCPLFDMVCDTVNENEKGSVHVYRNRGMLDAELIRPFKLRPRIVVM